MPELSIVIQDLKKITCSPDEILVMHADEDFGEADMAALQHLIFTVTKAKHFPTIIVFPAGSGQDLYSVSETVMESYGWQKIPGYAEGHAASLEHA